MSPPNTAPETPVGLTVARRLRAWLNQWHAWLWATEQRTRMVAAAVGAVLTVAAGCLALAQSGGSLVTLSYDLPFKMHRAGAADDVRLVYIDEFSGGFLDRRQQAALLDKIGAAGAKAVLYDIIFDRPSDDPKLDEAFAGAMLRFRGVDAAGNPLPGQRRRHVFLACGREQKSQTGVVMEQLIPPADGLLAAADDFGLVAFVHDEKFTVRELATGTRDEPSLTWKAAIALGAKLEEPTRLGPRWINYAGPPPDAHDPEADSPFRSCSAQNVLDGVEPGFLRDKIVVVGGRPGIAGAALGQDLFSTPFHRFDSRGNLPLMSGVEINANLLANLLRANWLTRSSHGFDILFVVLAGLCAGAGLPRLRPIPATVIAVSAAVIFITAGILAVHYGKVWFPWSVAAFLQLPLALGWSIAVHFYVERFVSKKLTEEKRVLREAFAKYLSPKMLDRLTEENFTLRPGGDKIHVAMMFTDIESFTDMCQRVRQPERIVDILNGYFENTTGHIFDHDGVIIKFIGDAIFAAWGAPLPDPDASGKAVRAAWKLFENDKLVVEGENLKTRIGLHWGEVVAGNIGSSRHVDYTLIGDAVNLTSRLEGLNKLLGTSILLSDAIRQPLGTEFRTRRVGRFKVKGRDEITIVHELLGPIRQEEEPAWITAYHEALTALEANDPESAEAHFTEANSLRGRHGDGPSRFFLEALKRGEPLQDGVVEMREK